MKFHGEPSIRGSQECCAARDPGQFGNECSLLFVRTYVFEHGTGMHNIEMAVREWKRSTIGFYVANARILLFQEARIVDATRRDMVLARVPRLKIIRSFQLLVGSHPYIQDGVFGTNGRIVKKVPKHDSPHTRCQSVSKRPGFCR